MKSTTFLLLAIALLSCCAVFITTDNVDSEAGLRLMMRKSMFDYYLLILPQMLSPLSWVLPFLTRNSKNLLTMNFKIKELFMSSSGTIDITFTGATCDVSVGFVANSADSEELQLEERKISIDLGKHEIHFHESILSWVYDLIVDIVYPFVKKSITEAIENVVKELIVGTLDTFLASLPTDVAVDQWVDVDYGLVSSDPIVVSTDDNSYFSVGSKMVFVASQVTPSTEVHVNGLPIAPLTDITTTDAFIHIAM
ncbi:Mite allergen, group-7 like protein, partial [Aduncisulcus paluster]